MGDFRTVPECKALLTKEMSHVRQDAIGKPKGTQLKVSVTASPEGGRATDHMVRYLAPP
jgi:uncharacterized protein YggU (UPF0235/DUF167 family)